KMVLEPAAIARQKTGIWPNEFTLHRAPDRSFVVLAYIWDAGLADIIHDHGSWGIIGTLVAKLGERKYERIDDGRREGYCELRETSGGVFGPGETTFVLPLDEGLHAMHNPTDGVAVSVNVYGKTVRPGYIRFFDPARRTVTRTYPPQTLKEVLAVKTLAAIVERPRVFRKASAHVPPLSARPGSPPEVEGLNEGADALTGASRVMSASPSLRRKRPEKSPGRSGSR
ncbi:MAG: cysteine dioxygenase family protein, partial [Syntrophaceae bacterium]|nr:cysteine dioxygenase family protein [Syntrophaceae bacterium]